MSGCSISTLDYECKTPQQQVIDDVKYLEYPCLSRIGTDTNVPLEFRIEKTSMFTDISQMYLSFNFKLEHTDGTKITEMEQVAPLCNFAYTVFSGVDVKIQDTNVSISDGYYPYLSYVNLLLFATKEEKEHYLREAIWIPDTAGVFDDISNGEEGMNDGYIRRMSKVQFGDEVHVMAKVMLDFKLYQLIPDKTEIYLRFNRTEARKCLIANEDKYKIAMSKARLLVPQINLTSYGRSSIPPSLSLQATRFHIVSRMVGKNDQNCDWIPCSGTIPRRLYFFQTSSSAYNGNIAKNIFNFKLFGLKRIQLFKNGESLPFVHGMEVAEDNAAALYFFTINATGRPDCVPFTTFEYPYGYFVACFDLTKDQTAGVSNYHSPVETGTVRLKLDYKEPLEESITIFCMIETSDVLQFDENRNCSWIS